MSDEHSSDDINKRLDELQKKIGELEREIKDLLPWKNFPTYPSVVDPMDFNKCSVCGMTFEGIMGYVCGNSACPSGVRY